MPFAVQNCKDINPNALTGEHLVGQPLGIDQAELLVEPDDGWMIRASEFLNHSDPQDHPWLNQNLTIENVITFENTSPDATNNNWVEGNKVKITVYLNNGYIVEEEGQVTFEIDVSSKPGYPIGGYAVEKPIVVALVEEVTGMVNSFGFPSYQASTALNSDLGGCAVPMEIYITPANGVTHYGPNSIINAGAVTASTPTIAPMIFSYDGLSADFAGGAHTTALGYNIFREDWIHYFHFSTEVDGTSKHIANIQVSFSPGYIDADCTNFPGPYQDLGGNTYTQHFFQTDDSGNIMDKLEMYTTGGGTIFDFMGSGFEPPSNRFSMQNLNFLTTTATNTNSQEVTLVTGYQFQLYYREPLEEEVPGGVTEYFTGQPMMIDSDGNPSFYDMLQGGNFFHYDYTCFLGNVFDSMILGTVNDFGPPVDYQNEEDYDISRAKTITSIKSNFKQLQGSEAEWTIPARGIMEGEVTVIVEGDPGAAFKVSFVEIAKKEILASGGSRSAGFNTPNAIQLNGGKIPGMPSGDVKIDKTGVYMFKFPEVKAYTDPDGWKEFKMVFEADTNTRFAKSSIHHDGNIKFIENSTHKDPTVGSTLANYYYQYPPVSIKFEAVALPAGWSYVPKYNITDIKEKFGRGSRKFGIPLKRVRSSFKVDIRIHKAGSTFSVNELNAPKDDRGYRINDSEIVRLIDKNEYEKITIDLYAHIGNGLFSTDTEYATVTGVAIVDQLGLRPQVLTIDFSRIFNNV